MERPRMFLDTKSTSLTEYQELLKVQISADADGVSYFTLSIDPDPNALYRIIIAKLMNIVNLEITAIWTTELPHLTAGVYEGFNAGDHIIVQQKSINSAITVKTGITLAFNEVIT